MQYILPISHFTVPFIVLRYISYAICIKAQKFVGMNHSENPVNRSWVLISENCFASVNALLLNSLFLDLRDRAIIFSALPWFCLPVPDDVEAFSSNWNSSETSMRKTRILPAPRVRSVVGERDGRRNVRLFTVLTKRHDFRMTRPCASRREIVERFSSKPWVSCKKAFVDNICFARCKQ